MALTQISTDGVKNDAVTAGKIPTNAVGSSELANNAVDTNAIQDDAVTADKLANSINTAIAANTAKTSNATHTGDVTGSTSLTIANDAVTTAKIAAGSITSTEIADTSIVAGDIADATITLDKLAHGTSSNNGKFLRANNGADPTFETIDLTALSASNLTSGTVPDARFPATLPAISGANLTNLPASGATLSGSTNNTVVTVTGANAMQGESNVTINADGDLLVGRTTTIDTSESFGIKGPNGDHCTFGITTDGTTNLGIIAFNDNDANFRGQIRYQHSTDTMQFQTASSERMTINQDIVKVNDGDIVIGTTGHGINFDTAGSGSDQLLDDYEEGSFSPSWQMTQNSPSITYYDQQGQYTKIGRVVHFQIYLRVNAVNANGSGILYVSGLPYNAVSNTGQGPAFGCLSFGYMDTVQGMASARFPSAYVEANDSKIYMYWFPDGSGHAQNMTVANNITNNTKIMMSGSYQTS